MPPLGPLPSHGQRVDRGGAIEEAGRRCGCRGGYDEEVPDASKLGRVGCAGMKGAEVPAGEDAVGRERKGMGAATEGCWSGSHEIPTPFPFSSSAIAPAVLRTRRRSAMLPLAPQPSDPPPSSDGDAAITGSGTEIRAKKTAGRNLCSCATSAVRLQMERICGALLASRRQSPCHVAAYLLKMLLSLHVCIHGLCKLL
ncbi:hypothetical protein U9M48_043987 [Paspalum notatum var. saurae]|uniref:Uncharacterized protein n=1 Tax=Paspalum notatum var. saurae TaxID=547442 RepID=A0AAQ3UW16_PASNO